MVVELEVSNLVTSIAHLLEATGSFLFQSPLKVWPHSAISQGCKGVAPEADSFKSLASQLCPSSALVGRQHAHRPQSAPGMTEVNCRVSKQ